MPKYDVTASFYGTTRFDATFTVEAANRREAEEKAKAIVEASGGSDTDLLKWEEEFLGGDGEYEVDVSRTDAG